MATASLETALELLDDAIADYYANPKPDYMIDGQRVGWSEYGSSLLTQREKLAALIDGDNEGSVLIRSRGRAC